MTLAHTDRERCPECGSENLWEDSFVSSYGKRNYEKWTIDVRCEDCNWSTNVYTKESWFDDEDNIIDTSSSHTPDVGPSPGRSVGRGGRPEV